MDRILLNNTGFEVRSYSYHLQAPWSDIAEILAYKQDLITIDRVCLQVTVSYESTIFVSEDDAGFWQLCDAITANLPLQNPSWRSSVLIPAFELNLTTVFTRDPA